MQPIVKIVVAVLIVALIAVIGLIAISNNAGVETPNENVQTTDVPATEATAKPEATQQPETEQSEDTATDGVSNEAQNDEAQDTIYEGALAGMTEEEIAQQAMAEEESHGSETETND